MKFETPIYFIYCSTGCTCCSNENHYRGPLATRPEAEEAIERYRSMPLLASQYASKGHYSIEEVKANISTQGDETIIMTEAGRWFGKFGDDEEMRDL